MSGLIQYELDALDGTIGEKDGGEWYHSNQVDDLIADYEQAAESTRALVKEIDQIMNGEQAAEQASLCDLVGPIRNLVDLLADELTKLESHIAEIEQRDENIKQLNKQLEYRWSDIRFLIDHGTCRVCSTKYTTLESAIGTDVTSDKNSQS